jgi:hypothetical protein
LAEIVRTAPPYWEAAQLVKEQPTTVRDELAELTRIAPPPGLPYVDNQMQFVKE